ncbi:MAG: ABC transporter permease subunit [Aquificae bacterium]|nr:ABC transporter permease subunit [Aquificota bacterium]
MRLLGLTLFDFKNLVRIKALWAYAFFLWAVGGVFLYLSGDETKVLLSLLSITLLIVPLVSVLFSITHLYDSANFIKLLLSQPVKRSEVLLGKFLALSVFLSFLFLLGVLPAVLRFRGEAFLLLVLSGFFLTFIYTALAFLIGVFFEEKARGVSVALILWLYTALIHDGFILSVIYLFGDYPLERVVIGLTLVNPVDLARLLVVLRTDVAALMGLSEAVFKEFFGSGFGSFLSALSLILWAIVPLLLALWRFRRKDL